MPDHSIKPVLCFGVARMASVAAARIRGMDDSISKPFGRQDFIDLINKHIT